jgi:hypothetical protein
LEDPIDAVPDPALTIIIEEATTARNWPPLTIVSARELLLILAEAELAGAAAWAGPLSTATSTACARWTA